jgi:hypothetical protein
MQNTWPVNPSSARRHVQADLIHAAVQNAPRIQGSNPRAGTGGDVGDDPEKLEGNPEITRTKDDAPDRGHDLTHLQISDTTNDTQTERGAQTGYPRHHLQQPWAATPASDRRRRRTNAEGNHKDKLCQPGPKSSLQKGGA